MRQLWREKLETTIHNAGMFDLRDWLRAGKRIKGLHRSDSAARENLTGHPVQDTFFSLFKSEPRIADELKAGLKPLGDLLGRAMETPNFEQLHETTRGDEIAAGMAAAEFFSDFIQGLPDDVKEAAQQARQNQYTADQAEEQAESSRTAAQVYRDQAEERTQEAAAEIAEMDAQNDLGNGAAAQAHAENANDLVDKSQLAQAQAEKLDDLAQTLEEVAQQAAGRAAGDAQDAQEAIEASGAAIAHAANQAAKAGDEKIKEAMTFVKGFTQAAGGDPQQLDPEALEYGMALFKNFPEMRDFAKILGWTKRVAKAEYRNSPQGKTEFKGYKVGELDIAEMAPQEWVAALGGSQVLRKDWIRRVADGEISHNDYEGKEELGRGPVVWVGDQSGSMGGPPAIIAKAIEWALIDICRADGREFHSYAFAGRGRYTYWHAPQGKPDYKGLFDHMREFLGGGTEPYKPLTEAMTLIEAGDLKADVVLATDGIFTAPPFEFLHNLEMAQERRPLRIETILIDASLDPEQHRAAQFSDRVTGLSSFVTDKGKIRDILKAVV